MFGCVDVREETLDATTDDGDMAVVVTRPAEGGAYPVVMLFIDAPGLRQSTRGFMARLAAEGYIVVTPDLHHRQGRLLHFNPEDLARSKDAGPTVWGLIKAMTDEQIRHDGARALDAAGIAADERYAVIGFCLGARAVVRAMEQNPERVVAGAAWHPSFLADDGEDSPHLTAASLAQPLYLGIGEQDKVQSIEMHQPFLDAVEPLSHVEVRTFATADHGFTWSNSANYHPDAAEQSWVATTQMFRAAFG